MGKILNFADYALAEKKVNNITKSSEIISLTSMFKYDIKVDYLIEVNGIAKEERHTHKEFKENISLDALSEMYEDAKIIKKYTITHKKKTYKVLITQILPKNDIIVFSIYDEKTKLRTECVQITDPIIISDGELYFPLYNLNLSDIYGRKLNIIRDSECKYVFSKQCISGIYNDDKEFTNIETAILGVENSFDATDTQIQDGIGFVVFFEVEDNHNFSIFCSCRNGIFSIYMYNVALNSVNLSNINTATMIGITYNIDKNETSSFISSKGQYYLGNDLINIIKYTDRHIRIEIDDSIKWVKKCTIDPGFGVNIDIRKVHNSDNK